MFVSRPIPDRRIEVKNSAESLPDIWRLDPAVDHITDLLRFDAEPLSEFGLVDLAIDECVFNPLDVWHYFFPLVYDYAEWYKITFRRICKMVSNEERVVCIFSPYPLVRIHTM